MEWHRQHKPVPCPFRGCHDPLGIIVVRGGNWQIFILARRRDMEMTFCRITGRALKSILAGLLSGCGRTGAQKYRWDAVAMISDGILWLRHQP